MEQWPKVHTHPEREKYEHHKEEKNIMPLAFGNIHYCFSGALLGHLDTWTFGHLKDRGGREETRGRE